MQVYIPRDKPRQLLLDCDPLIYRAAYNSETLEDALAWLEGCITAHATEHKADLTKRFITSPGYSLRKQVYPKYKQNRAEKPELVTQMYEVLLEDPAYMRSFGGLEADDMIGIYSKLSETTDHSIICSVDKDLRQVPGWHITEEGYIYVPYDRYEYIQWNNQFYGRFQLYMQMLMGDRVDNVPGLIKYYDTKSKKFKPCGEKTALKLLHPHRHSEADLINAVMMLYSSGQTIYDDALVSYHTNKFLLEMRTDILSEDELHWVHRMEVYAKDYEERGSSAEGEVY